MNLHLPELGHKIPHTLDLLFLSNLDLICPERIAAAGHNNKLFIVVLKTLLLGGNYICFAFVEALLYNFSDLSILKLAAIERVVQVRTLVLGVGTHIPETTMKQQTIRVSINLSVRINSPVTTATGKYNPGNNFWIILKEQNKTRKNGIKILEDN
ncbi:hypothetical protein ACJX0J_026629, partial [Zea mays]